jgi:hypothetical protein
VTRVLPAAATPYLATILEALLQVQEFKAFEVAVALLNRSELPRREQHELLGAVYLRRGFLASAAEEWMAVCNEQPDARALLGLAQVAVGHGLVQDAMTFAAEALKLDPTSAAATRLLAGLERRAA